MAFGLGEFIKSHSMNADVLCRLHGLSESESRCSCQRQLPQARTLHEQTAQVVDRGHRPADGRAGL